MAQEPPIVRCGGVNPEKAVIGSRRILLYVYPPPLRSPNPPAYTPTLTEQPDMAPLASAEPHVAQLYPSCSHCWPTSMCGTSSQQLGDPLGKEVDWVYPAQRWASSGYKRGTVEPHVALPMPRGSCRAVLSVPGYLQLGLVAVRGGG